MRFASCNLIRMALVLHKHLSKEKQLQLYISTVYMGQNNGKGVIGLSEAASAYFNKNFSDLSKEEFIILVAMLDAPNYYHPIKGAERGLFLFQNFSHH